MLPAGNMRRLFALWRARDPRGPGFVPRNPYIIDSSLNQYG
jgi:hypothetical protein